jgi:hypothetical protein
MAGSWQELIVGSTDKQSVAEINLRWSNVTMQIN